MERSLSNLTKNGIRKEINEFAQEMELKLAIHDEDRGESWKQCSMQFFVDRMKEEIQELETAIQTGRMVLIQKEAADVANFAMMASWKAKDDWVNELVKRLFSRGDEDVPGSLMR
jgi:hydrogenase maturation factor